MKKVLALLVLVVLTLSMAACGGTTGAQAQAKWKISVEGIKDSAVEFTDIDYGKLATKDLDTTLKKKDGTELKQKFTGVELSKVLESLGVKEFTSVTVEAKDGYSKDYTPEIAKAAGTILAVKADGKDLDESSGPVELVADGQSGNMWIKSVAKIKVTK